MPKKFFLACLPVGLLIYTGCLIWSHFFTIADFVKGFFHGMSAVFVLTGLVALIWNTAKK